MKTATLTLAALVAFTAQAGDSTGRITGKVRNKAGQPVPDAVIVLVQKDINQRREIKVRADGSFIQVGLNPKEFEMTVSAPGYQDFKERIKIMLADALVKDIVLYKAGEAAPGPEGPGKAVVVEDPGAGPYNAAVEAFGQAAAEYKDRKYNEALPLLEVAYQSAQESIALAKNAELKADAEKALILIERPYAVAMAEVGLARESKRDLLPKATPILEKIVLAGSVDGKANPKEGHLISLLAKIGKVNGNKDMEKKYQTMLDVIVGPQPELPYNEGVNAFNAGNNKAAREHVMKAIDVDPKFAESYWLLGILDYADGKVAAAKANFKKYLELAPSGAKAGDVRAMLAELK